MHARKRAILIQVLRQADQQFPNERFPDGFTLIHRDGRDEERRELYLQIPEVFRTNSILFRYIFPDEDNTPIQNLLSQAVQALAVPQGEPHEEDDAQPGGLLEGQPAVADLQVGRRDFVRLDEIAEHQSARKVLLACAAVLILNARSTFLAD